MERQEDICPSIASVIRDSSAAERLVRADEILAELREQGLLDPERLEHEAYFRSMLKKTVNENTDLKEIGGPEGASYYYSDRSLSGTYAGILLLKAQDPVCLIAEMVRDSSRRYPSPIPVACLTEPPFDLTRESILMCLQAMGEDEEYRDIAQTITSVGNMFLYSSFHLDADYAAMLAEWLDVGQNNNP